MCEAAGTLLPGDDCSTEPCVPGSGCYDLGDGRRACYRYCDLLGRPLHACDDLAGTVCTDALHDGNVGVCAAGGP
ncbi:MAG: hypothetical protein HY825_20430 [Acidobacteria bacterium]|nr:hypothetical protein [Acidobacteriota bacterium]